MTIRRMEPRDREAWIALTKEFYGSGAVLHPVPEEYFARTFAALTSGSPFLDGFVAEEDGTVAASLQLSLTWSNEAGGPVVWMEELYVRPEFRGRGVGTALIRRAFAEYGGKAARFRLEAEPSNENAMRLYRRLGFGELPYLQMIRTPGAGSAVKKESEGSEIV